MPGNLGTREARQLDPYGEYTAVDDPEFEAKVRAKIGAPYEKYVNKSVAANVHDPERKYNVLGANVGDIPKERREEAAENYGLASLPEGKHVLGIGAGASPSTFAHEFRHDAPEFNELGNRVQDTIFSNSPAQYVRNLEDLYGYYHVTRMGQDPDEIINTPFADKERWFMEFFHGQNPNGPRGLLLNAKLNAAEEPSVLDKLFSHPIDYLTGNTKDTPTGKITQGTLEDRVAYPFLNFVGSPRLPKLPEGKANGGMIENTTYSRKIL